MTPRGSTRRSSVHDKDLGEVVDLSGHGGDLYEIVLDWVEALSPLQTMSKGHEVRMATIVSTLERLQPLESSVAAFSESAARQQVRRMAECPLVVVRLANSSPVVEARERAAIVLCSGSSTAWRRCLNVLKHLRRSLARWLSTIVERYVALSSHVRRALVPTRCSLPCIFPAYAHLRRPGSAAHGP